MTYQPESLLVEYLAPVQIIPWLHSRKLMKVEVGGNPAPVLLAPETLSVIATDRIANPMYNQLLSSSHLRAGTAYVLSRI